MKRSPSIGHSPSPTSPSSRIVFCASECVLVGGGAADEDRLPIAQPDDDAALVEGGPFALPGADGSRGDRGLGDSVHGVSLRNGWAAAGDATPAS